MPISESVVTTAGTRRFGWTNVSETSDLDQATSAQSTPVLYNDELSRGCVVLCVATSPGPSVGEAPHKYGGFVT